MAADGQVGGLESDARAGHPGEQRTFAVNDFIMRKRQDEVFMMMIKHRESEIILMILPKHGIEAEVT